MPPPNPAQASLPAAAGSTPTHTYTVRPRSVLAPPSRAAVAGYWQLWRDRLAGSFWVAQNAEPMKSCTPESTVCSQVLRQPEIQVHCSPRALPNKLKLRKGQLVGPLSFELAADWDRRTRILKCGCCCQACPLILPPSMLACDKLGTRSCNPWRI